MGVSKKGRRNSAGRIRKKKNYVHHSPNWSAKCKDAHTPPSCFIDSCISGHVWWGFVFFHLCSITPTPTTCAQAGTHMDTHSCVSMCYPPTHTHTLQPIIFPYAPILLIFLHLKIIGKEFIHLGEFQALHLRSVPMKWDPDFANSAVLQIKHKSGTSLFGDMAFCF